MGFPVKPLVVFCIFLNINLMIFCVFVEGKVAASNNSWQGYRHKNYGILSTILLTTVNAIKRQFSCMLLNIYILSCTALCQTTMFYSLGIYYVFLWRQTQSSVEFNILSFFSLTHLKIEQFNLVKSRDVIKFALNIQLCTWHMFPKNLWKSVMNYRYCCWVISEKHEKKGLMFNSSPKK